MGAVPELDLADPAVKYDPITAFGRARARSPVARVRVAGIGTRWVVTRHEEARAMLGDPRFEAASGSVPRPQAELDGPAFRSRIAAVAQRLLSDLPKLAGDGIVDVLEHFARPLSIAVSAEVPQGRKAGATVTHLIANAVETLLAHEDQLTALLDDLALMPNAVEELLRFCDPHLLSPPRFPSEDLALGGVLLPEGEPVSVAIVAVNRDPAAFPDPDRFDIRRPIQHGHVRIGPGPLARVVTEVALTGLLRRFPQLTLAVPAAELRHTRDGGTWRLDALPIRI